MAVTYYFTGNTAQTTIISVVFNVFGTVIYYFFERIWGDIKWGKLGGT
jgi:uncharacterized membrane protein